MLSFASIPGSHRRAVLDRACLVEFLREPTQSQPPFGRCRPGPEQRHRDCSGWKSRGRFFPEQFASICHTESRPGCELQYHTQTWGDSTRPLHLPVPDFQLVRHAVSHRLRSLRVACPSPPPLHSQPRRRLWLLFFQKSMVRPGHRYQISQFR